MLLYLKFSKFGRFWFQSFFNFNIFFLFMKVLGKNIFGVSKLFGVVCLGLIILSCFGLLRVTVEFLRVFASSSIIARCELRIIFCPNLAITCKKKKFKDERSKHFSVPAFKARTRRTGASQKSKRNRSWSILTLIERKSKIWVTSIITATPSITSKLRLFCDLRTSA